MSTEYVKTIECPKCRYRNVAGTKFCKDCGTAMGESPIPCGKCGKENTPEAKFCPSCGNNLQNPIENDPDIRHLQEALRGKYVIQKSLGEGGFGRVFLVEHTRLKQNYVVKLLSADSSRITNIRNRFFQEAVVLARLKHPNIVPIMDVEEYQGRPYYIMSYLNGGSLEDLLQRENRLSTEKALDIASKILSALSEVHGKGIIHRDLKPDNVLLDESGEPILIDFGIARVEEEGKSKTSTGFSIGTPIYMSPEQLDARPITFTTDIYSMGIMLFELLTGNPPFEGSMSSLITQHNSAELPSVSGKIENARLEDGIQAVLQKACAKEPSARYNSAKEMREALLGLVVESKAVVILSTEPIREETLKVSSPNIENREEESDIPKPHIVEDSISEKRIDTEDQVESPFVKNWKKLVGAGIGVLLVIFGAQLLIFRNGENKVENLPAYKNSIGMEFLMIPAGGFDMGCSVGDEDCEDDEKPRHRVTISNSFYLGKYEVTQGQWKLVMGNNPSYFQNCGDNCPVESVSWNDIHIFIQKLCGLEKMNPCKYRLPTEAEWEYAARAGSKTRIYSSQMKILGTNNSPDLDKIAYYGGNSGVNYVGGVDCSGWSEKQYNLPRCGTHPIGQKKPNNWGLYDMIGNVWEWIGDWYDKDYYKISIGVDPKAAKSGELRVLRGGSWSYNVKDGRLSNRGSNNPDSRFFSRGFRLLLQP